MTLYADKPFEVGEFVGFGTDNGTVEDIGPRSTRIRKMNGTLLTVPNSDIVQARISNFTKRDNALFLHVIGLRYETTLEQIEWLLGHLRAGLREHPKVEVDEDMPRVRLAAFGASSIDIEVTWLRRHDQRARVHGGPGGTPPDDHAPGRGGWHQHGLPIDHGVPQPRRWHPRAVSATHKSRVGGC